MHLWHGPAVSCLTRGAAASARRMSRRGWSLTLWSVTNRYLNWRSSSSHLASSSSRLRQPPQLERPPSCWPAALVLPACCGVHCAVTEHCASRDEVRCYTGWHWFASVTLQRQQRGYVQGNSRWGKRRERWGYAGCRQRIMQNGGRGAPLLHCAEWREACCASQ